jgi:hypothetical protein
MAEQSGPDSETLGAGAGEGATNEILPAKRVIWTPERLAKAAATRAETKRKKDERAAKKAAKEAEHNAKSHAYGDPLIEPPVPVQEQRAAAAQRALEVGKEVMPNDNTTLRPAVTGAHRAATSANGFDWEKSPLPEALNKLADLKRDYDRILQVVLRRQSASKPQWTCFTQAHKDIAPQSVQKLCLKNGQDGKWAFRDDGCFRTTAEGIRIPEPVFCCNHLCFAFYQGHKPLMALSRH